MVVLTGNVLHKSTCQKINFIRDISLCGKIIRQIGQKVYTQKIHIFCAFGGRIQPRSLYVLEIHSTFELHSQTLRNFYYQTSLHKQQSSKKIIIITTQF